MHYHINHLFHLIFVFLLVGVTFAALAAPKPENRKAFLKFSGIASLIVLLTGFALLASLKVGFPLWIVGKLICWLVLSAMAGLAYRLKDKIPTLWIVSTGVIALAVMLVEFKF